MNHQHNLCHLYEVDAKIVPWEWPWATENHVAIEQFWKQALAEKPKMFNGRVLLAHNWQQYADRVEATYFETDFASFLCWLKTGCPDKTVANGFSLAALRSADGAYICGIMGEHTANAGKIYFPGGTPDPSDIVSGGKVDFLGSALRELEEEAGLTPDKFDISDGWFILPYWPFIAYLKPLQLKETAEDIVQRLTANLAQQQEPELAGFKIIRNAQDAENERIPLFLKEFFAQQFSKAYG